MNYRLTIYPVLELNKDWIGATFNTPDELKAAKTLAANLLLYLQDITVLPDYSNIFISEQLVDGVWEEFEPED